MCGCLKEEVVPGELTDAITSKSSTVTSCKVSQTQRQWHSQHQEARLAEVTCVSTAGVIAFIFCPELSHTSESHQTKHRCIRNHQKSAKVVNLDARKFNKIVGLAKVDLRIFLMLVKFRHVPIFTYESETVTAAFMLEYLKTSAFSNEKL